MSRVVFLIGDNGKLLKMNEAVYDSENLLQELLASYPDLIPGDQINSSVPRKWMLVTREMAIPDSEYGNSRWSVDHLFLDQDGIPTLVEVKRSSDTRIRREIVGQLLEYAANASSYWAEEKIRATFESGCESNQKNPEDVFALHFGTDEVDYEEFWQTVKTNLQLGKLRLIFLADQIPFELASIIEYLNEQMNPTEVYGIELKQFVSGSQKTLVPRLIGQTTKIQQKKSMAAGSKAVQWDEGSFMKELENRQGNEAVAVARKALQWINENQLRLWWGKGKRNGSFFPMQDHKGQQYWTFSVWTYDGLEIPFQHIKTCAAFAEPSKRMAILNQLNTIPGVNISPESVDKRPSISYSVLSKPENLQMFFRIWEDYLKDIKLL